MNLFSELLSATNVILNDRRADKMNILLDCEKNKAECTCADDSSDTPVGAKIDLIVLIDTSGSMEKEAKIISGVVQEAIKSAEAACKPNLKVTFLGVDGIWEDTVFNQSHRDYLYALHGSVPLTADVPPIGYKTEQGANAIKDLSQLANWRKGACRAIFYISDEELDGVRPRLDFAQETLATQGAIDSAKANDVSVFAHHITNLNKPEEIRQNYRDLCEQTNGEVFFSETLTEAEYTLMLTKVICNACGVSSCKKVRFPDIQPCVFVKWGDSKCDGLTTSEHEVMILTVCNCYQDITFNDLVITQLEVTNEDGSAVAVLPSGNSSVNVHPIGVHCFGDIAPCSCISREFVIVNEGAKPGVYKLWVKGIHFSLTKVYQEERYCFEFTVCKD